MKNFIICGDNMSHFDVLQYNPLALAFVGDAVHSLYVRTRLVCIMDVKVSKLQKLSSSVVRAVSQSRTLDKIINLLTEDELMLIKRARNTRTNNIAKNATPKDYKMSTSFEALIGFLYLTGQTARMNEFLDKSFEEIVC